jgi:CheY-like chemotaxis protein
LTGELIDFVSNHASEKQVEIIFSAPSDEVFVKADKQKLKQVLLNLLNNAIKYNREKGFIEVRLEITKKNEQNIKQVRISVTDTGFGITEENISKLFNPFERVGADKTGIEGSGLGLAVSKKLTEAMGGKIGVESEFQKGSTFWVEFPFAEGKRKTGSKQGTGDESAMNNEILGTVLYVEDNESNIELIGQALLDHRPGIVLFSDKDGSQAVRLALEKMPDLILLDLNLPEIQGDEILRQIIQNEKIRHIPVLIVSADAMPGQIKKMLQLGAREYITKPLDINMFLKAVDNYIKPGEKKSLMN